ncbi:hypothetical protein Poli38472_004693 [Pythium oligandrum]|uniref:Uncharacterized protein n=1 Tax=Pythium oligandrum TaxID=41045 RepID=A0A8K1FG48_PYTOL|nr:hypothetical protein Poli38472_004693 [Pythium oligandrum]|eukprot:TMW59624.1 hypothetical protein Poli38472_004693 [Pythium oligandrum]
MTPRMLTLLVRKWQSPQRRLVLFTTLCGVVFVITLIECPTLTFHELPTGFPSSFRDRNGFFQVLRWLEHLLSADELAKFMGVWHVYRENGNVWGLRAGQGYEPRPQTREYRAAPFRNADELVRQLQTIVTWESYFQLSKMGLRTGLLLFLYQKQQLTKRVTLPCICLCVLVVFASRMTQSCLLDVLGKDKSTLVDPMAFVSAFLGVLFVLRCGAMAIINVLLGRAYQAYFGGWPTTWKEVPRYVGSKEFAVSTLFYTAATVSVMTLTLRSLSEAALQIEAAALCGALMHYVFHHFGGSLITIYTKE